MTDSHYSPLLEHLPKWVVWLDPATALFLTIIAAAAFALAARLARRSIDPDLHWTERARLSWPERLSVGNGTLFGALAVALGLALSQNPLGAIPREWVAVAAGAVIYYFGRRRVCRVEQRVRGLADVPRLGQGIGWLTNAALLVALAMALFLEEPAGVGSWLAWVATTLIYVWVGRGGLLRRALQRGSEPSSKLREALALERADDPNPPPLYQRDGGGVAQAFALVTMRSVLFTHAIVAALTPEQLRGVYRHEIAHLAESPAVKALRNSLLLPLWTVASWRPLIGLSGYYGYLAILVASVILVSLVQRFTRKLEERADAAAQGSSEATGAGASASTPVSVGEVLGDADPEDATVSEAQVEPDADSLAYATGLERMYEVNVVPAVLRGKGTTHPHLYDRMLAVGVQPEYPRPEPPPRRLLGAFRYGLIIFLVALYLVRVHPQWILSRVDELPLVIQAGTKSEIGDVIWDLMTHTVQAEHANGGVGERGLAFTEWCVEHYPGIWALDTLAFAQASSGDLEAARVTYAQLVAEKQLHEAYVWENLSYRPETEQMLGIAAEESAGDGQ